MDEGPRDLMAHLGLGHASLRIVGRHCRHWLQKNFCKLQLDHSSNFHNSGRAIHKHLSQTLEDSWAPNIAGFLKAEGFGVKLYTCSTPSTTKTCVRDGGVADAELKRVTAAAWAITSSNEWTPPNVLNYYSTLMASAKSLQSVLQVDYP